MLESIAGAIANGVLEAKATDDANRQTQANMRLASDINRRNTLDSAMLNVQGLKKAGLNPALASNAGSYSVAGVSSQAGTKANYDNTVRSAVESIGKDKQGLLGVAGALLQSRSLDIQGEVAASEVNKNNAAADVSNAQAEEIRGRNNDYTQQTEAFDAFYRGWLNEQIDGNTPYWQKEWAQKQLDAMEDNKFRPVYAQVLNLSPAELSANIKRASSELYKADSAEILSIAENAQLVQDIKREGKDKGKLTDEVALAGLRHQAVENTLMSAQAYLASKNAQLTEAEREELNSNIEWLKSQKRRAEQGDAWTQWNEGNYGRAILNKADDYAGLGVQLLLGGKASKAAAAGQASRERMQDRQHAHERSMHKTESLRQTRMQTKQHAHEKSMQRSSSRREIYDGQGSLRGVVQDFESYDGN